MSVLVGKKLPYFGNRQLLMDRISKKTFLSISVGKIRSFLLLPYSISLFVCPTEIIAFQERITEFEKEKHSNSRRLNRFCNYHGNGSKHHKMRGIKG